MLFYLERDGRFDFDKNGMTLVTYTGGTVRRLRREEILSLRWYPGNKIKPAWQGKAPDYSRELARLKAWAATRGRAVVTGRVRYENGQPAANVPVNVRLRSFDEKTQRLIAPGNARLWMQSWPGRPRGILPLLQAGVRTRADGTFRAEGLTTGIYDIYLASGGIYVTHDLKQRVPDWVVTRNEVVTAREKRVTRASDLVYTRGALMDARVVDAETGKPLEGGVDFSTVPVNLRSNRRWFLFDDEGRVRLRVPTGEIELSFLGYGNISYRDTPSWRLYNLGRDSYDLGKTIIEVDGKARRRTSPVSVRLQIVKGATHRVTFRLRKYVAPPLKRGER